MKNDITIDEVRYLTAREAAELLNYAPDYISRLCREGRLKGQRSGRNWIIESDALKPFLEEHGARKEAWHSDLSRELKKVHVLKTLQYSGSDEIPRFRGAPNILLRLAKERRRREETLRKAIVVGSVATLLFTSSMGLVFSGVLPAQNGNASVAFVGDVGTVWWKKITSFVESIFTVHDHSIPPAWQKTLVWDATSTPAQRERFSATTTLYSTVVQNNTHPVIERVRDEVRTVVFGGITSEFLETRLQNFAQNLVVSNTRQIDNIGEQIANRGGGNSFDDIDILNSSWTGGTISGAAISGGSLSGSSLSISGNTTLEDIVATTLRATNATSTNATSTNLYLSGSFGFGSETGLLRNTSGAVSTLTNGSNGQVLKIVGGNLAWSTDISGGGGSGAWATTSDNLAVYPADPTQVVIIGSNATTTTGDILEVAGNSLFRGAITTYSTLTTPRIVATSSIASVLPFASTTALSATTLCLSSDCISAWPADTSFSTTSASYFSSLGLAFSTTSSDYWKSVNNFFSTTSASFFSSQGLAFSTTSSDFWKTQNNFFSTTSANHWSSLGLGFSSTSADYWGSTKGYATFGYLFPSNATTTLLNFNGGLIAHSSSTITNLSSINSTSTNATSTNLFATNANLTRATTTQLAITTLTSSLLATNASGVVVATTTLSTNYLAGALGTINGTTLNAGGSIIITAASSTLLADSNTFSGSNTFSSLITGSISGNAGTATALQTARTINGTSFDGTADITITAASSTLLSDINTFTNLQTFGNASSTLFSSSYASSTNLVAGNFTLGNLNGPLQANNGVVSATTSILAIYGGTGQTSYAVGDILYADTSSSLTRLPIGVGGQVLKVAGGVPTWGTDISSGGGGGAGAWSTTTNDLAIYPTDTSDVVIVGNSATATANSIFEVFGRSYFSNTVGIATTTPGTLLSIGGVANFAPAGSTLYSSLTLGSLTATSSLNVTGNTTLANATSTNFAITAVPNALLATRADGSVYATTSISSLLLDTTGNWSGTFDNQEGSYYLANSFSTTSASNFAALGLAFSTTSSDYWQSQRNFFSTTSANYWSSLGLGFSSTSADYWGSTKGYATFGYLFPSNATTTLLNFNGGLIAHSSSTITALSTSISTSTHATSTSFFSTIGRFTDLITNTLSVITQTVTNLTATTLVATNATTTRLDALDYVAVGRTATTTIRGDGTASILPYASTTMVTATTASSTNLFVSGVSNGLLKTNASGQVSAAVAGTDYANFGYPFPNNATSTRLTFSDGLLLAASSTIGNGTQAGGITISGGATTTGNLIVQGTGTSTFAAGLQTTALNVTSSSATSTFANGIQLSGGCFRGADGACIVNANLSAYVDGSGSGNRVAYWSDANTITSSANLTFDGTTLTARELGVSGTTAFLTMDDSDTTGTDFRIDVADGSVLYRADVNSTAGTAFHAFSTDGNEFMRLTAAGNLGIGTTSPYAKLSVVGQVVGAYFTGTTTATSTFGGSLAVTEANATSTFAGGIDLSDGCFAIDGTCLSVGGSSFAYLFPENATTTLLNFNGGLIANASSSISALSAITSTSTYATSTSLFSTLGRFTDIITSTLSAITQTVTNLTATTLIATNATTTRLDALDYVAVGRTATTTIRGDGIASTLPFASTTMITATTASTTNLIVSSAGGTAGCATFSSAGVISNTGSACGGSGTFPFTPTTNFGVNTNATSTTLSLFSGLNASSTIRFGNSGVSNFIFDGATGNLGVGTTSPYAKLSIVGETVSTFFTATSSTATSTFSGHISLGGHILPTAAPTTATSSNTLSITLDSTGIVGDEPSIAVGADGFPIISYYDTTNTDLKVTKCGNASCTSGNTTTTVDGLGDVVGEYSAIAVPSDGLPVIAYYRNGTSDDLVVMKCGNAACSSGNASSSPDTTNVTGLYVSMAIGADDLPIIAYQDSTNDDLKTVKCGNAACTSGNTLTTIESTGVVGLETVVRVPSDGLPVIAYQNNATSIRVAKCTVADCSSSTVTGVATAANNSIRELSMGVGSDDLPFIAWTSNDGAAADGALESTKCLDTACTTSTTKMEYWADEAAAHDGDVAVVMSGQIPTIFFATNRTNTTYDATQIDGVFAYACEDATCNNFNFTITKLHNSTTNQIKMDAIADNNGRPRFVFYEASGDDLIFVDCIDRACGVGGTYATSGGSDIGSSSLFFKNIYATKFWGKQFNIAGFDLAEMYEVEDATIEAGDLVRIKDGVVVEKTDIAYDSGAIGVISTQPGLLLSEWEDNQMTRPVALAGRVPVKVTNEGGDITAGDYLAPSSLPGIAMKATEPGLVVGRALESYVFESEASTTATVLMFVQPMQYIPGLFGDDFSSTSSATTTASSSPVYERASGFMHSIFALMTEWLGDALNGIQELFAETIYAKNILADIVTTKTLCIEDVCVTKNQLKTLLESAGLNPIEVPAYQARPSPETDEGAVAGAATTTETTSEEESFDAPEVAPEEHPQQTSEPSSETSVEEGSDTTASPEDSSTLETPAEIPESSSTTVSVDPVTETPPSSE